MNDLNQNLNFQRSVYEQDYAENFNSYQIKEKHLSWLTFGLCCLFLVVMGFLGYVIYTFIDQLKKIVNYFNYAILHVSSGVNYLSQSLLQSARVIKRKDARLYEVTSILEDVKGALSSQESLSKDSSVHQEGNMMTTVLNQDSKVIHQLNGVNQALRDEAESSREEYKSIRGNLKFSKTLVEHVHILEDVTAKLNTELGTSINLGKHVDSKTKRQRQMNQYFNQLIK